MFDEPERYRLTCWQTARFAALAVGLAWKGCSLALPWLTEVTGARSTLATALGVHVGLVLVFGWVTIRSFDRGCCPQVPSWIFPVKGRWIGKLLDLLFGAGVVGLWLSGEYGVVVYGALLLLTAGYVFITPVTRE